MLFVRMTYQIPGTVYLIHASLLNFVARIRSVSCPGKAVKSRVGGFSFASLERSRVYLFVAVNDRSATSDSRTAQHS
jgi:hypothetical protein